jgi:hypothetical protein
MRRPSSHSFGRLSQPSAGLDRTNLHGPEKFPQQEGGEKISSSGHESPHDVEPLLVIKLGLPTEYGQEPHRVSTPHPLAFGAMVRGRFSYQ